MTVEKIAVHAEMRGIPLYDAVGEVLATGLLSGAAGGKVKQFFALAEELRGLAATTPAPARSGRKRPFVDSW